MSTGTINDYLSLLNNIKKTVSPKISGKVPEEYLGYFNKRTTKERIATDLGVTGLGMAGFVADGGIAPSDAPIQGFQTTYTQQHLTHKVRLSFQTYYFMYQNGDAVGVTKGMIKEIVNLKDALTHAKNYYAQNFLSQGFGTSFVFTPLNNIGFIPVTTATLTGDGVKFFSTAHLSENGSTTFSNVCNTVANGSGTPSPVFTYDNYAVMHQIHALKKDGRGNPFNSTIDTLLSVKGSSTAQTMKRIKGDLDKGRYPASTPGTNGSYEEAASVASFNMIELMNYGGTGVQPLAWYGFDSNLKNDDYGFQYIESMTDSMTDWFIDQAGNQDAIMNANCLCTFGAADLRIFMASAGDGASN